jgi:prepilin-type processing-associated H-X9-DG protein
MIMKTADKLVIEKNAAGGFTLVELVVVIATVALLAALLLPALAGTRPNTQSLQCMENQRQLILAWQMYAQDNSDILPPNDYPYTTCAARDGITCRNWVFGTMWKNCPQDAIDAPGLGAGIQTDPKLTCLAVYNQNNAIFKCPADNTTVQGLIRQRSLSMNSAVGTIWYSSAGHPGASMDGRLLGSPVAGGWLSGNGGAYDSKLPDPNYRTYGKTSDITAPRPSDLWVLMDENPQTINDGSMAISMAQVIVDYPANSHNGGAGLSYADGHSEVHKWLDAFANPTLPSSATGGPGGLALAASIPCQDLSYLQPRTSALR